LRLGHQRGAGFGRVFVTAEGGNTAGVGEDVGELTTAGQTLLAITENGYGKRTVISEYPIRGRGGLGVITMKVNDRNGKLVGIRLVSEDDQLILITDHGQVLRTRVGEISTYGRNTQGVKVMVTDPEETVVSMARLPEGEEDEDDDEIGEDGLGQEGSDGEVAPDGDAEMTADVDDAQDGASDDEDA